jgi:hypothetical protein
MARQLKRLTARTVATMKKLGRHADGGNLYLTISKTGAGVSRRWTFLYSLARKQREAGFGPAAEKAAGYRSMLAKGIPAGRKAMPRRRARRSANAPLRS